jgi:hypothetical protein
VTEVRTHLLNPATVLYDLGSAVEDRELVALFACAIDGNDADLLYLREITVSICLALISLTAKL